MAFMYVTALCYGCNEPFSFNPERVPSIPIDGVRQPVCQRCVDRVNPTRVKNGLEPIKPHPEAYEPLEVA